MNYSSCDAPYLLAPERCIHALGKGVKSLLLPMCKSGSGSGSGSGIMVL